MRKQLLAIAFAAFAAASAFAADITYNSTSTLFKESTEWGDIEILFKKCMANELYTFYTVKLDGKIVNSAASSDNIGPFSVSGKGWIGGNHLNGSAKTARTVDYSVAVDGQTLTTPTAVVGDILTITVHNELLNPAGTIFAYEDVTYNVAGNSIHVAVKHEYQSTSGDLVALYYGMQSMFENETEILTPGGKYNTWTTITPDQSSNYQVTMTKAEAPNFCTYVEHSANGYQAAYLISEGIGRHNYVGTNDVVYIGNSWRKSYHKMIGNKTMKKAITTQWKGIYSWFKEPITDNCRTTDGDKVFEYGAYVNGLPTIMHLNADGTMSQTTGIADVIADDEVTAPAEYYNLQGVKVENPAGGIYIVRRGKSVVKELVR